MSPTFPSTASDFPGFSVSPCEQCGGTGVVDDEAARKYCGTCEGVGLQLGVPAGSEALLLLLALGAASNDERLARVAEHDHSVVAEAAGRPELG